MEQSLGGWQYDHTLLLLIVTMVFLTREYQASEWLRLQQLTLSHEKEKFTFKNVNK